jgi:nucleoid-associated protein YgaU
MKFNPIALFTTLAVAAAGTFGYVSMRPVDKPALTLAAPAPAEVAKVEVPKAVESPKAAEVKPIVVEPKVEEKVAAAATPVVPAPAVAPVPVIAPSFDTVRVETGGEAVIAGRAAPDTEVVAKLNGEVIATAKATADGSFVMIPAKPLPAGAGTLSLESNGAGTVQVSSDTVAVAVKEVGKGESTVAVMAPDQPTKIIQAPASPSNAVVLDAVDYDAAGNIVFSGRAHPGATIRLYVDNTIAGESKTDDGGKWVYNGQAQVPAGTHTLRADEIAVDGTVASRVELPFLREEAEKVAAAAVPAPVVAPAVTPTATAEATTPVVVAPAAPAVPAAPQPTRIVIQPGNNLWTLSRNLYGAGRNYTVIYEANKDQIRNPRLIYPGQIITAPAAQVKTP